MSRVYDVPQQIVSENQLNELRREIANLGKLRQRVESLEQGLRNIDENNLSYNFSQKIANIYKATNSSSKDDEDEESKGESIVTNYAGPIEYAIADRNQGTCNWYKLASSYDINTGKFYNCYKFSETITNVDIPNYLWFEDGEYRKSTDNHDDIKETKDVIKLIKGKLLIDPRDFEYTGLYYNLGGTHVYRIPLPAGFEPSQGFSQILPALPRYLEDTHVIQAPLNLNIGGTWTIDGIHSEVRFGFAGQQNIAYFNYPILYPKINVNFESYDDILYAEFLVDSSGVPYQEDLTLDNERVEIGFIIYQ